MTGPLTAIVGDTNPQHVFNPIKKDIAKAKKAEEELGRGSPLG
ncbi:MAG TPA: hypothetical protein VIS96_04280 [Terrimicrobiaceae bacterium]